MQDLPELSQKERIRYSRHLILPEVGLEGQARLKASRVLVVGAGGLGSPIILYLAASGVGTIGIVDFDTVDVSNLQRQVIYTQADVGLSKVSSAARRASALNPEIKVVEHRHRLSAGNARDVIGHYDLVVDGTDNFSTRYLVNDACVLMSKLNVYGSIYRFEGQASVFGGSGPCYRCLYPDPPPPEAVPNCAEGGVLGVMAGVIGLIQATETIKVLLGKGETLSGKLLLFDSLAMRFDCLNIKKNPSCPLCGEHPSITEIIETSVVCQTPSTEVTEISAADLNEALKGAKQLTLLDVRNPEEHAHCRISDAVLIPLPELANRISELDAQSEIVVYCKGGVRSKKAAEMLLAGGFKNVRSLKGGILAWARDVDPAMPVY